jgi:hypothetical protein
MMIAAIPEEMPLRRAPDITPAAMTSAAIELLPEFLQYLKNERERNLAGPSPMREIGPLQVAISLPPFLAISCPCLPQ